MAEVTRKMGISEQTFYHWKKKFGGLMPSEVRKLWQLEEENSRLRRLVGDLSLDNSRITGLCWAGVFKLHGSEVSGF